MIYHTIESSIGIDSVEEHRVVVKSKESPNEEIGGVFFRLDSRAHLMTDLDWYIHEGARGRKIGSRVLSVLMKELADEIASVNRIDISIGNERTLSSLMKITTTYGLLFNLYTINSGRPQCMVSPETGKDMLIRARLARILEDDDWDEELDLQDQLFIKIFITDEARNAWVNRDEVYFEQTG